MALTTPILYSQVAFDASKDQVFKFNVIGGDQITGSTITIKDNATLTQIFTTTVTSYAYNITVPAGSLTNGKYYQASIVTHNATGESSPSSNVIQFWCYAAPTLSFVDLPSTHIINGASYTFNVSYNQAQNEALNAYKFDLFDDMDELLSTSGTKYDQSGAVPLMLVYTFSGFEDKTQYKIQCTGTTVNGTIVDTGLITISVQFKSIREYSNLYLTNNCADGNIIIESNVTSIDGISNPVNPTYIDDKEIDLTVDGSWAKWSKGYVLPNDYTIKLWGRDFISNTEDTKQPNNLLELTSANGSIVSLSYWENSTKAWYELRVQNADSIWAYVVKSAQINKPAAGAYLFVWIRCDGALYDVKIENLGTNWNGGAA